MTKLACSTHSTQHHLHMTDGGGQKKDTCVGEAHKQYVTGVMSGAVITSVGLQGILK